MELKPAKRKKFSAPQNSLFIPKPSGKYFEGFFSGSCCIVKNEQDMHDLFQMGFYGKGSLSKSEPVFNQRNDDLPDIIYDQQWQNRKRLAENQKANNSNVFNQKTTLAEKTLEEFFKRARMPNEYGWKEYKAEINESSPTSEYKVQTVENNEPDTIQQGELHEMVDDVLATGILKQSKNKSCRNEMVVVDDNGPRIESFMQPPSEVLQLTLEEAFFLSAALDKLAIFDEKNQRMTSEEMWSQFHSADANFLSKYVIYYWFRSRGWVVRSGLKYGGHFLLYEKGPDFCHSSYLVQIHDDEAQLQWEDFLLMQRLVETFKKDILFCTIVRPPELTDDDLKKPDVISKLSVRQVICRRWIPAQQRA